jgi:serine/threonine-protein kinase
MTRERQLPAEERLQEAITLYLQAVEAGRRPDPAEHLARYPDCAAELREFFHEDQRLHELFAPFRTPALAVMADSEASEQTVDWVRVALPAAAPDPATPEMRETLRRRLRAVALLLAVGLLIARGIGLTFVFQELAAAPWLAFTRPPCYGNAALVVVLELLAVGLLAPRRHPSLRRLRVLEALVIAPPAVAVAWNEVLDLARLAPDVEGQYTLALAYGKSLPWVVFMVGYGVLIPNSWRRCAAVVSLFALLGLLPDLLVLAGHQVPAGPMAVYVANKVFWLSLAGVIVIYGAHRLEVLRQEAATAQRLGQYLLKEHLDKGAMGDVYLAEHVLLRRPCALKLIRPERAGDPKNLLLFEREARATATLTHPNTVQVFDYGRTEQGTFYYVMEYLPGLTLQELVELQGPMPPERAIHFLRQLCGALQEAHGIGLIHRDIKPGNVLVCERGGIPDVAKLLDFGLVLIQGPGRREGRGRDDHNIAGTPLYMAPEQATGRADVDGRADIYGLGAVAYFLLTGHPPFTGRSVSELLTAHRQEPPVPPTSYRPELSAELEAVVLRCLAKDPAERFANVGNLETALAACRILQPAQPGRGS